ncbi:hypothetical protein L6V77_25580 [Myxococcota bacterium]|nr:hypothetical protein [Myxococcota bacterium]
MSGGLVKQEFMMLKHLGVVAAAVTAFGVSAAQAGDLVDGKKGLGFTSAIGGPAGLAFDYGTGNLAIEGILGIDYFSPKDGDASKKIVLGAGAHFMALRAEKAAFSVGGRLNLGTGTAVDDAMNFGLDIPMRVYWFADEHVSLHVEGGIAIKMIGDKGSVFSAASEGTEMNIVSPITGLGMTFWW